jgi:hypothetical protein
MHSQILINEFLPNPVGADQGNEWIEIINISNEEIDLSDWEIQVAGISFKRAFKFPSSSKISPGEYILVCEQNVLHCNYYTTLLAIQNGGKETDGIRLVNENLIVVDTVLYDTTNSNQLKNDFDLIEIDENIIDMPPEGCSLARRNFQDTNFSIKDFFITCSPTPGKENVEIGKVAISEISTNYIEFYSPQPPNDIDKWYIKDAKESSKKIYLQNDTNNNFFSINTQEEFLNIYLYSPEHILIDSFTSNRLSPNYTYCRLQSSIEENFVFCEHTKGEINVKKVWLYRKISEIRQINTEAKYIVHPCVLYKFNELYIISDESEATATTCLDCRIKTCLTGEIFFKKQGYSHLQTLEVSNFRDIDIPRVTKTNYLNLFKKVVTIEAIFERSDNIYSYFLTDIGQVKMEKGIYLENHSYILQGVFEKEKDLELKYVISLKKESIEKLPTLEKTGAPLFYIPIFFVLLFILTKIFVKLTDIKLKRKIK